MTDQIIPEPQQEPAAETVPSAQPAAVKNEASTANLIPMDGTRALAPNNHQQLMAFIDQMIKAKAFPKALDTREKLLAAWNYAAQLGLPPQPSLRNIAIIHGSPSLFGDLPLALAQRHMDYIWHEEFCIDEKYEKICIENKNLGAKIFSGVFRIQRDGMKDPQTFHFTWDDATRAGINSLKTSTGNPTVWANYPQIMIVRKARAVGLRSVFADALCGAAIAEHDHNEAPDLMDVSATPENKADELNRKFSGERDVTGKA